MKENYKDIGYTVVYDVGAVSVDFKAYEIIAEDRNKLFYEGVGGCGADDKMTDDLKKANTQIRGHVKWDGCSHYYFGDEDGYLHLCGDSSIENTAKLIKRAYIKCGELMKKDGGYTLEGEFEIKD